MMKDPAPHMDYPAMIDDAMRSVVRRALTQVATQGLPGDHHFYISFLTTFPGARLSPQLRERFPQEMTIVIQHQFWDLQVDEDQFSVMLSFNNIPEKLVIPYASLTAFADPSIKFGLQFHTRRTPAATPMSEASFDATPLIPDNGSEDTTEGTAQVISLDAFRKK
jgi:hypothetical protein